MNTRFDKHSKIVIYNLNDEKLNQQRSVLLEQIAFKLKQHYSQYVNFPDEFWTKLVNARLANKADGIPFTLVALAEQENGNKKFLGTISAERGCEELNDINNVWITGLYVESFMRKSGIGALLCKEILNNFNTLNISSFRSWAIDPKLDEVYQRFGMNALDKPTVLGYQIVVRSGETNLILKNILRYLNQKDTSASVANHSAFFAPLPTFIVQPADKNESYCTKSVFNF